MIRDMPTKRKKGRAKTPTSRPRPKRVLVGVRVAEGFHRRIRSELVRRELSLQQMVVDALTLYFRTPVDWDYAATTYVLHDDKAAAEEAARRQASIDLFLKYIDRMPPEKVEVLTRAMEWDLQTLKSSRRKPGRKRNRVAGKG